MRNTNLGNNDERLSIGDCAASNRVDEHVQKASPKSQRKCHEWPSSSPDEISELCSPCTTTTSHSNQTTPDVLNETSVVKDADKLLNPKPTSAAKFHWLGAGIALAFGTNLLLTSTALITSTANFLHNDATWSIGLALYSFSCYVLDKLAGRFAHPEKLKERCQAPTWPFPEENERVLKILDKLDPDGKFGHTTIIKTESIGNFAFIDRVGREDVLLFNPTVSSKLNDRELTNMIAHELAHANKLYTGMKDSGFLITDLAAIATFWSTFVSTYNGASSGGFIPAVSGIALGFLYASAVRVGAVVLLRMSSRANEIRTDIRAVEMTQDVGGYLSALEKLYFKDDKKGPKESEKYKKILGPIQSHPPFERRKEYILSTTGK